MTLYFKDGMKAPLRTSEPDLNEWQVLRRCWRDECFCGCGWEGPFFEAFFTSNNGGCPLCGTPVQWRKTP